MSEREETRHFRNHAVTVLAIATGALGFGLFGTEFHVSMDLLPAMKLAAGALAIVFYAVLAGSVSGILQSGDVSGRQVARGPLRSMFLVMFYVVSAFVVGVFESPLPV